MANKLLSNKKETEKKWKLEYKIISAFILIISTSLSSSFVGLLPAYLALIFILILTKKSLFKIFNKILVPLVFIFFTAAFFPFVKGKEVLFQIGNINIYSEGLDYSLTVFAKSTFILALLSVILYKEELADVINVLRTFKINRMFLDILVFSYRGIMIFSDYLGKMMTAARLRGSNNKSGNSFKNICRKTNNLGNLTGALISRSIDKSELVHNSMMLRAYCVNQEKTDTINKTWKKPSYSDVLCSMFTIISAAAVLVLDRII